MPTPEQKRQAAAIFTAASEGKTIQFNQDGQWIYSNPFHFGVDSRLIAHPEQFRIAPDPIAPGHNPDQLTVSQVGDGWRLLEESEIVTRRATTKIESWCKKDLGWLEFNVGDERNFTYRTRLSVADLAALDKPAKPQTKRSPDEWMRLLPGFQILDHDGWNRHDFNNDWQKLLTWDEFLQKALRCTCNHFRLPSDEPAWRLPDPPAGKRWIRQTEWKESELPEGTRPLFVGEEEQPEDEQIVGHFWKLNSEIHEKDWWTNQPRESRLAQEYWDKHRTTRPLPVFNPRDLPGFRPLLPTEQNHRDDFTEVDLPEGCRPLLKGEECKEGDEMLQGEWTHAPADGWGAGDHWVKHRTKRPLPAIPRTRPWSAKNVPGNCYIRWTKGPNPELWTTIAAVCQDGILTIGSSADGASEKINFTSWEDLFEEHEYSLDRKTWAKCETTEAE